MRFLRILLTAEAQSTRRFAEILCAHLYVSAVSGTLAQEKGRRAFQSRYDYLGEQGGVAFLSIGGSICKSRADLGVCPYRISIKPPIDKLHVPASPISQPPTVC